MKLQEFSNDSVKWVLMGTFDAIKDKAEADELVAKFQDGNKRFVLLDGDEIVKEYLP